MKLSQQYLDEGIRRGKILGKQKAQESMTKKLLKLKYTVSNIRKITGLSKKTIEEISKKYIID